MFRTRLARVAGAAEVEVDSVEGGVAEADGADRADA